MNHQDVDSLYKTVEKIVHKLAWDTAQRYPISYEESLSEAHLAFMKAVQSYNPERGTQFSSWCYFTVWTHLKDVVMKRSKERVFFIPEVTEEMAGEAPPTEAPSVQLAKELGEDAKLLVEMLLETPEELIGRPLTPKRLLTEVKKILHSKGWSWNRINDTVNQITTALRAAWAR